MINSLLKTLIPFCLLCIYCSIGAQNHIGIRGGINSANVSTTEDGAITEDRIIGINTAFYLELMVGEKFALQPEINFLQKGFKRYISETNDLSYKLDYLDFEILLKYKSSSAGQNLSFFSFIGPYYGRAINGRIKNHYDNEVQDYNFNSGIRMEKNDIGAIIGGGLEIAANRGLVVIDIRYAFSLIPLNDNYLADGDLKHQGIILSVGYAFTVGR